MGVPYHHSTHNRREVMPMYIMNKNGRYFTVEGDLNADMLVDCSFFKKKDMYQA